MSNYDDALASYVEELLLRVRLLTAERDGLKTQLSEAHRQIAILEDQLTHFYL